MSKPLSEPSPPQWIDFLLKWCCPSALHEELQGDLHEQFQTDCAELGDRAARWRYIVQVVKFLRPYFLRRKLSFSSSRSHDPSSAMINSDMIKNYFKIAFR